jgi:hypothetical protein
MKIGLGFIDLPLELGGEKSMGWILFIVILAVIAFAITIVSGH